MAIGGDGGCQHVCTTVRRRADAGGRRVSAGSGGGAPPPHPTPLSREGSVSTIWLTVKGSNQPPPARYSLAAAAAVSSSALCYFCITRHGHRCARGGPPLIVSM